MSELYIGLMSGTSMDAIDAVLVNLSSKDPQLLATYKQVIPDSLRQALFDLCTPGDNEINRLGEVDIQVGQLFAETANNLLAQTAIKSSDICAIGSHGQTIRHHPDFPYPFTLQIGDPNIIAEITGITTVADFRRRDIAVGGQGAPLTPAFHAYMFRSTQEDRVVLNLGGIANITLLTADPAKPVIGFDTGPGNTLLDQWVWRHLHHTYDENGQWSRQGKVNQELLAIFLKDPYFALPPPKSTGREYFNINWLEQNLAKLTVAPSATDVQATLVELTAITVMNAINQFSTKNSSIFVCGGGSKNQHLMQRLHALSQDHEIYSTEIFGIHPDWVEAMAFAWLAQQTLLGKPGNLPSVTGAQRPVILGAIYNSYKK